MARWDEKTIDSSITQCSRPFKASYKDLHVFDAMKKVETEESDKPVFAGNQTQELTEGS